MCDVGYGCIINVIFIFVKLFLNNLGVFNIVRVVVVNWVKILVNEVGLDGIIVNNLLLGYIEMECFFGLIDVWLEQCDVSKEDLVV